MTQKKIPSTHIRTEEVRLSFPSLSKMKPRARGSEKMTYQATILLPEDADLSPYKKAMAAAIQAKFGELIRIPAGKNPLRDCADKSYKGFDDGMHYIALNSDRKPGCVDRRGTPVDDPDSVFYPGCWVRAFINAFAWDHPTGGKGVSFGLLGLQFVRDDERLDGGIDASQMFDALDDLGDDTEDEVVVASEGDLNALFE